MTTIEAATPAGVIAQPRRVTLGPPGILLWLVVAIAIVLALDTNSRASFAQLLWVAPLWLGLAGWWLLRFGWWAWAVGGRSSIRGWLAWALVPATMGLVFFLTRLNVPYDARLALSRPDMDQTAAEIMAGGSTDRTWIGWYPVQGVERLPDGVRFLVEGSGFLSRWGFAYSPSGAPTAGSENPLWCCDDYLPLDDGWYVWTQEWD